MASELTIRCDNRLSAVRSVSSPPAIGLSSEAMPVLCTLSAALNTSATVWLVARPIAVETGDALFACQLSQVGATLVYSGSLSPSTVAAVAHLGSEASAEITVELVEVWTASGTTHRRTLAMFDTTILRSVYGGTYSDETIEQAVAAVATATAQAVIATTQANLAIAAEAAVEGMLGEATTFDERLDTETAARIAGDEQLYDTISLLTGNVATKMDKVPGADLGKIAIFDGADGSIGVSVSSPEDFIARQPGAAGQLPELLEDGSLLQSGILSSDVSTALSTTIPAKMDKTPGAAGDLLDTDAQGNARRSGLTTAAVSTAITQAAGAVRHDTAQALSAAAKAQVCSNIGLSAPVCRIEPLATGIGSSSVRGTGGTWYSLGALAGMRLQFRGNHQFAGAVTSCTFAFADRGVGSTLAVEYLDSALASWEVTSSGGRILIDNVDVAAKHEVITIAYTRGGSPGNWTANLTANGIPLPQKTGLPNAPEVFSIGSTTNTAGGWVSYQPHLHSWS